MFFKNIYGKKWKLQASKVLGTGILCMALSGAGTGVTGVFGDFDAGLPCPGLLTAYADEFADRPEEVEEMCIRDRISSINCIRVKILFG